MSKNHIWICFFNEICCGQNIQNIMFNLRLIVSAFCDSSFPLNEIYFCMATLRKGFCTYLSICAYIDTSKTLSSEAESEWTRQKCKDIITSKVTFKRCTNTAKVHKFTKSAPTLRRCTHIPKMYYHYIRALRLVIWSQNINTTYPFITRVSFVLSCLISFQLKVDWRFSANTLIVLKDLSKTVDFKIFDTLK